MAHTAFSHAWPDFRTEVHLLIIQRNELFARSLARYLGAHYAMVHVVGTAAAAELVLRAPGVRFHVVCGHALGPGDPDGVSCIVRWRNEFPGVLRAVLATGAEGVEDLPTAVDALFRKPSNPEVLLELLQISTLVQTPTQQPQVAANKQQSVSNEDLMKTTNTKTKAHDLKTLKDKTSIVARPSATAISTAQGFTVA
jgi:DNA-binding NarL/FixJ family response regulator